LEIQFLKVILKLKNYFKMNKNLDNSSIWAIMAELKTPPYSLPFCKDLQELFLGFYSTKTPIYWAKTLMAGSLDKENRFFLTPSVIGDASHTFSVTLLPDEKIEKVTLFWDGVPQKVVIPKGNTFSFYDRPYPFGVCVCNYDQKKLHFEVVFSGVEQDSVPRQVLYDVYLVNGDIRRKIALEAYREVAIPRAMTTSAGSKEVAEEIAKTAVCPTCGSLTLASLRVLTGNESLCSNGHSWRYNF